MIITDPYAYDFRGTFTPLKLPKLRGWYDASDAATITHSAGLVSGWGDKSPLANHAFQATTANKFSLVAAAQNGLDVMRATGLGFMDLGANAVLGGGAFYIFVVAGNTDATSGTLFLASTSSVQYAMHLTGGNSLDGCNGRMLGGLGGETEDGSIHLMSHLVSGGGWRTTFDAAESYSVGAGFGGLTVIGLCAYQSSALWLDGSICEIIYGSAALSPKLIAACRSYLKTKWGTP